MSTILLVVVAVALFFIGLICPRLGGKIQRKTDDKASRLERMSNWFWDPITWWAKKSIESTRKIIVVVTQWGKSLHGKADTKQPGRKNKSTKS